jgi:lipoprotein-anchoring transpeptidase ErfK/SrfK
VAIGTTDAVASTTTMPPDHSFTVARAVGEWMDTYRSPVDAEVWWSLSNPGPYEGDRVVLVLDQQDDWLLVDIPVRPNGSTAWVHLSDVILSTHDARIMVDLSEMRLWAWEDGVLVAEGAIGLGTDETPTPPGNYFLNEIQAQEDPDTLFGSWILGTSGFSEVLDVVEGGDPAVAIHGTNDPSVLGTRVSLGCIRVHEDVVERLARLPLGTPVEVRA